MDKWIAILSIGLALAMFGPLAYTEHSKYECRVEGIKAKLDTDSIIKICGKQ